MVGTVLSDLALLVGALSPLVLAGAVFLLVLRKGFKRAEARLRGMAVTLDGIDRAVNSVPPGTPAMKDRVATIEATQSEHIDELAALRADLVDGFAAVHQRLDQMAADAARHHPEDPT